MHPSSQMAMRHFFDTHVLPDLSAGVRLSVLDVGGMDVNGSYRSLFSHPGVAYLATDLSPGPGVDLVQSDPYRLPFPDASFDVVISGQTFEHSPRFWELAAEMGRVLKPAGLMAVICPSAGPIHAYPVDCYRFLPDAMSVVAAQAGLEILAVEHDQTPPWKDLMGIMKKPATGAPGHRAAVPAAGYLHVLEFLHHILRPRTYFEIGTDLGASLALARCASVSVDPMASSRFDVLGYKPGLKYFATTSDAFFAAADLGAELSGTPVDLAFIDGFHSYDQVLRDVAHLEPYCAPESVVCIHDVLPRNASEADRQRRTVSWAGDVWKAVDILSREWPYLRMACLDVDPTGLLLLTGFTATRPRRDLDGLVAWHGGDVFPSFEELKDRFRAVTPERFFAVAASDFLGPAIRREDAADWMRQAGKSLSDALATARQEQWKDDELRRLVSQVRVYPLFPYAWKSLAAHLREHDVFAAFMALIAEQDDAFEDAVAGGELNMIVADVHLERCDADAARQALGRAVRVDAGNPAPCIALSQFLARRGDAPGALGLAREAVARKEDSPRAQHQLGNLLLRSGDLDGAHAALSRALELDPAMPGCHFGLSQIHGQRKELDQAMASARAAIALRDDVALYHHHLGNLLVRAGDLDGAQLALTQALERDPDIAGCHFALSQIHSQRKDLEQAMASVRQAIARRGDVAVYHHHLGNLLARAGDPDGAMASLERALDLDPGLAACREQLERLRSRQPSDR